MANTHKRKSYARENEEIEQAYRSLTPSRKKSKKRKKAKRAGCAAVALLTLVAILLFLAAGYLYLQEAEMNGIILENVYVAGVDVGGLTQKDAITAVEQATAHTYTKKSMVVTVLDNQVEIPPEYAGTLNVRGAVRSAYKFGNSGSQEKRKEEQDIALKAGYHVDLVPHLGLNEAAIRNILKEFGKNYNTTLNQSTYEITGEEPNQVLVVNLGTPEYGLNLDALYTQITDAYSHNVFAVTGECGMMNPDPIDLKPIAEKHYKAPVDASFDPDTFEIVAGTDGYGIDLESAENTLQNAKYGTKVEIPFVKIKPEITAESLKTLLYRDTLESYTAEAESDSDRDVNLQLACAAIDGVIIYPDQVFSFNETLGERTKAKGYRPGTSYENGKIVKTIGGGICQVSSALYYCVLSSELEIVYRDNHGYYPSYVPLGMDATVSWDSIDFKFRNNSKYPVKISAIADRGSVTVELIGTEVRDYRVELEYEAVAKTEYGVTYQTMKENNSQGYKNGDYIVEPCYGYKIKTYRCKYDKATGEQQSRDFIEQSNYMARDGVVCRIEGSDNSDLSNGYISDEPGMLP